MVKCGAVVSRDIRSHADSEQGKSRDFPAQLRNGDLWSEVNRRSMTEKKGEAFFPCRGANQDPAVLGVFNVASRYLTKLPQNNPLDYFPRACYTKKND